MSCAGEQGESRLQARPAPSEQPASEPELSPGVSPDSAQSGVALRQLLIAVGEPLVDVFAAPQGFDLDVRDIVIVDPEDDSGARPGDLVLVIGVRGRSAVRVVRAAARDGAVAVAVKVGDREGVRALRDAAMDGGIALLGVRPEVRWERLESFARSVLDNARLTVGAEVGETGDLFALAQTVASMTGGSVSIEDTANRVVAYSRSDDEADELRRLSILGRQGPEPYLAMLREWGIYQRLRSEEAVVCVDERPELGIRRRMAIGIHAGTQPLGTIWVQEVAHPLAEHTEKALLGAARVAALHMIRQRTEMTAAPRFRENLLAGLLDGRIDSASVAGNIGAQQGKPAVVVAFMLRAGEQARPELELRLAETAGLISVHAAAYRRSALVTTIGSRVYVLLPDLEPGARSSVLGLTKEIVAAATKHQRCQPQAGVGSIVDTLGLVAESRAEADRVLDAMTRDLDLEVATIADVRAHVLISSVLTLMEDSNQFSDPRIDSLVSYDQDNGLAHSSSLLAYLEAFGDVAKASKRMHVHPNTLRYRVHRAAELAGIDLDEPAERLNAHLQLLLARRRR